ncbi:CpsB/CapC family capsule biosynthesis tyrosine phosphatase [uncultured Sphaerotilus sp.]|uniref:CpsB/CapC family capsule biosynthesis tyrosine phosphatase n=1 Tax=uncultured Sphaerotilus sp. TaxID=474984 RepID=UPI0030CA41C1
MLDLHVHVLPGIDDGPRTMEDALALARALADDGIEHIVATPHIYPGVFDNSAARIGEAFDEFQAAVSDAGIDLTMTWAAEVRICPEILDWIELRRLPMLNGSLVGPSTALIELPDGQIPVGTDKLMGMMLDRGITPLMAHPERNKAVMEQPARLEALRRLGCKFQVTAGSLLGDFGTRAQTTAQKLLDAGWVDVIATDSHNRSSRRPRMGAARAWLVEHFDEALALRLTKTQPTEIAGVSSFAVQSGEQRLVFRDLPAMSPLEAGDQWSVDLMLGANIETAPATPEAAGNPGGAAEAWSLIDFRIDAVVDDLNRVSMLNDAPDLSSGGSTTSPRPTPQEAPSEDWVLPLFGQTQAPPAPTKPRPKATIPAEAEFAVPAAQTPVAKPVRPPVPASIEAPAAAEPASPPPVLDDVYMPSRAEPALVADMAAPVAMPKAVPVVEQRAERVHAAIPAIPVVAVPEPMAAPMPVVEPAGIPAVRGLSLNEVPQRPVVPSPVEIARIRPAPPRQSPLAQAGHQASSMAAVSRSIAQTVRDEANQQPDLPSTAPDGKRQGFRLSDLNPLPNRRR